MGGLFKKLWMLCSFLLLVVEWGYANNSYNLPYRFQYYTNEDGLPQNTVDDILMDSRGFMWFATWNGLSRFDGYTFETFRPGDKEVSLPSHFVYSLAENERSQLWVGTSEGAVLFDLNSGTFIKVEIDSFNLSHVLIRDIYCHSDTVWLATSENGLLIVKQDQDNQFHLLKRYDSRNASFLSDNINVICPLDNETILIGSNNGAFLLNKTTLQFIENQEIRNAVGYRPIIAAHLSPIKELWLASYGYLARMDPDFNLKSVYRHSPIDEKTLLHNTINAICHDANGTILVGTLGGLCLYDQSNDNFIRITAEQGNINHLNNAFVNSLYSDKRGIVWIGTEKGGVNRYNIYQNTFNGFVHSKFDNNSLSHSTINSIYRDGDQLWVGTAGGGLNLVEMKTKRIHRFVYNPANPKGIISDFISSVVKASDGKIYVGTWGSGMNRKNDNATNQFDHFFHYNHSTSGLSNNFISTLFPDPRGFLVVATEGGLNLFNPENEIFTRFPNGSSGINLSEVGCIELDHKGFYWVGTRRGLYRFPMKKIAPEKIELTVEDIEHFQNNNKDPNSIPGNYITALKEDSKGQIWIGTYGNGIAKIQTAPEGQFRFESFNQANGLCNNVVYCIEEDKRGILWISTDNGLSAFDPVSRRFINYYERDGLLNNQFYWSASFTDPDGMIYFGGVNGLNCFNPEKINEFPFDSRVVFTNLKVFNSTVNPNEKRHGHVVMEKSLSISEEIRLSYRDNVFSIEFSALDYSIPEKVSYAYMMEGVDNDWVAVGSNRRFATYTNLKGGEYLFKVKCTDSTGNWSETISTLKVRIIPPFWATTWFSIVLMISIMSLVMAYVRWSTLGLIEQKRKLEKLIKERTQKIEEQKETLVQQSDILKENNLVLEQRQKLIEGQKTELESKNREILAQRDQLIELNEKVELVNQLRLRFFTNISHEFKTPLTLIIDPIQTLMERWKDDMGSMPTLRMIDRNARRLLHLINQLMDFRRVETGKIAIRVEETDMVSFMEDIFQSFGDLAQHQQIDYRFEKENPPCRVWFDKEKLENILYNLLSNAFKFTPSKGSIVLTLRFDDEQYNEAQHCICIIKVADNGVGIEKQHLDKVFDRFYQVETQSFASKRGSGIGLSLTRELVEALRGFITVESNPGKGSLFCVHLPCSRSVFSDDEIVDPDNTRTLNLDGQIAMLKENFFVEPIESKGNSCDSKDWLKPLILIAEDNYDLRKFLVKSLSEEYRLIEVENGKEGFDQATRYTPDLIISDIMMPVMDGIEFCSRIKTNIQTSHIPLILLTAKTLTENWVEGLETGADDYIPKPFNLVILQARIKNLIENRKKMIRLFSKELCPDVKRVANSTLDEEFIQKVYDVLDKNYIQPDFTVEDFAREMCISKSLLYKKLKSLTGMSISDYVNGYKIKKSLPLLTEGRLNVADIAFKVGFNDPKYFSRVFRKFIGMTPTTYSEQDS